MLRTLDNIFYMRKLKQSGEMTPGEVEKVLEDREFDVSCLRSSKSDSPSKKYDCTPQDFIGEAKKQGFRINYSCFSGPYDTVHYLEASGDGGDRMELKLRKFNIRI